MWAPDKQAAVFSKYFSIPRRHSITKMSPWCAAQCRVRHFFLINQHFILQIFSFMIDVFTPKRISPDCPFKSNQSQTKILILRCTVCLCGVMHTAEIDSMVGCTQRRLSPWSDAYHGVFFIYILCS